MQCNSDHSTHPDLWAQGITSINRRDLILCSTFNPQRIPKHCKAHPCYWWLSNAGGKQGKCVYNSGSEPSFRIHAVYRGCLDLDARQPLTDTENILLFLFDKNTPIKEILISSKEVFKLWPWATVKIHRLSDSLHKHLYICASMLLESTETKNLTEYLYTCWIWCILMFSVLSVFWKADHCLVIDPRTHSCEGSSVLKSILL